MKKQFKTCAIWTRVSSKKQQDKGGSLEHQKEECIRYAERNNIKVEAVYGETYESAKVQGTKFKQMIADIKKKKVDCLIVYSMDRFGRNLIESLQTISELKNSDIRVVAVNNDFDDGSIQGEFMRNLTLLTAELDNKIRREKCMAGVKAKLEAGLWCGKSRVGYNQEGRGRNTKFTINQDGELLRMAFHKKLQGESNCKIQRWLKTKGLDLSKQEIHKILTNPFYAGKIKHKMLNNELIDGKHPPLISWAQFQQVQDIMSGRTGKYIHDKEADEYPLLRHVLCANDRMPMTKYEKRKNNKTYHYYKCNTTGCRVNHNADDMHNKYSALLDKYNIPSILLPLFEKIIEYRLADSNNEQLKMETLLKKRHTEVNNKITKVKMNRAMDIIDDDIYQTAIAELNKEKQDIEAELEGCGNNLSNSSDCVHEIAVISCKLGDMWRSMKPEICKKIQNLVYPDGILWDKQINDYRTMNENAILASMKRFLDIYKNKKENISAKKQICPLVCG